MASPSTRTSDRLLPIPSPFHRSISPSGRSYSSSPAKEQSSGEFHRPTSPTRVSHVSNLETKRCMCSPTMHQGSFRCGLHKNSHSISYSLNSLVRRALAAPPSSQHQLRRRVAFQTRPSRLSVMSTADDDL
ncbi:hypothetical protein LguiA_032959 [Lonicera macranthoides]